MSAVILTAMPADHERVRSIVAALVESDLSIFWERTDPGDRRWPDAAKNILEAPACVFFWSAATTGPDAAPYRTLANRALAAGKAISVRLDGGTLPSSMAGCTTYDLRGWRARASSLFMLDLVAGVKAKAAGLDPPSPRAARQLLLRRAAVVIPSLIGAFALGIGLYRDIGIDRIAGPDEARDWAHVRAGNCPDLSSFLANHGDGVHAPEAQALLQSKRTRTQTQWRDAEWRLGLFVDAASERGAPTTAAAREAAQARGLQKAEAECRDFATGTGARYRSASVEVGRFDCERFRDGETCRLHGTNRCAIQEPVPVTVEWCGPDPG